MARTLSELIDLLDLETLEVDLFRGRSQEWTLPRTFGGQVAAQALVAAVRTVDPERKVHSLHSYFLRPGDPTKPIVYEVDRARDGRSFTTRRVVAIQHGHPIYTMSADFHADEPGVDHADPMPDAPDPESLPSGPELAARDPERYEWIALWAAFDLRREMTDVSDRAATQQVWLRAGERLPDEPLLHVCVLTYLSDMTLLGTALRPHLVELARSDLQLASLDHAMWFHRPFRADEWLLYDQFSPSAQGGRGLAIGRIFTQSGVLAATVAQEGLMRLKPRAT